MMHFLSFEYIFITLQLYGNLLLSFWMSFDIYAFFRFVLVNEFIPIFLNVDGNWIFVNDEHPEKQRSPIDVTPSGIVIVEIFEYENAYSPIIFNDNGNWTFVNDEYPSKQHSPIDVTPSGIVIVEIFEYENAWSPILGSSDGKKHLLIMKVY